MDEELEYREDCSLRDGMEDELYPHATLEQPTEGFLGCTPKLVSDSNCKNSHNSFRKSFIRVLDGPTS